MVICSKLVDHEAVGEREAARESEAMSGDVSSDLMALNEL
jgi:hypothetical protein